MLNVGDIKSAREIGKSGTSRYIYVQCPNCNKTRWVSYSYFYKKKWVVRGRCVKCAQCACRIAKERPLNYKGGKYHAGYKSIYISDSNPLHVIANKTGYVLEHRLIMAIQLDRCLQSWEIVHHKNGIKTDNRIENLEILDMSTHSGIHGLLCNPECNDTLKYNKLKSLQKQRMKLDKQIRFLKQHTMKYAEEGKLLRLPLFGQEGESLPLVEGTPPDRH